MVLSSHAAYLLTVRTSHNYSLSVEDVGVQVPQLASSLSSLHQLLESRVNTFSKLCHLQGKLDLLLAQGQATESGVHAAELALTTPLITITLRGKFTGNIAVNQCSTSSREQCQWNKCRFRQ